MTAAFKRRGARLGQHFLKQSWVASALADAALIQKNDTVVEIGPGTGALTRELLSRGAHVLAIEKDEALALKLHEIFAESIDKGSLTVISDDIRNVTPESLGLSNGPYTIAANIPYYITGEIIRQFLTARAQPVTMALLVQKEVAERIARSKKESILSLSVKVYGTPKLVRTVGRGNFSPPPSVDSAILAITNISRSHFKTVSEDQFFRIVKAGFAAKRKMLRVNLSRIETVESVLKAFEKCGLSPTIRAEDVPLEKWLLLAALKEENRK